MTYPQITDQELNWQIKSFDEKYAIRADAETPCLLISGWSYDTGIFEWLLPGLAQHFIVKTADIISLPASTTKDQLVENLARKITQPTWIIGWSLGGNIAVEIAHKYPEKVMGICLFSTTPLFIKNENWPVGMPNELHEKFLQGLLLSAQKTLRRFDLLLTKDDGQEKNLRSALSDYRQQQKTLSLEELIHGLNLLVEFDQRQIINQIQQPMLWCFGEVDAVVNVYVAQEIKSLAPMAKVEVFRQTAHLPFLTDTDHFFKSLLAILHKKVMQSDKKRVADSFSKAAESYDVSAKLQQMVAEELLNKVSYQIGILLDIGSGTGYWTEKLVTKTDSVIGMDMAEGMLRFSKNKYPKIDFWLQADLEDLPLAEHSVTQIFSSLAVQWCESTNNFLEEWHRVLKPGGKVFLATLGPQTLFELRNSWKEIDSFNHVNDFLSTDKICEQISCSPFFLKSLRVDHKVIRYSEVKSLMYDLKNIGAKLVKENGVKGLLGKNQFVKLQNAYDKYRDIDGLLPATYEVIYICLEKHI